MRKCCLWNFPERVAQKKSAAQFEFDQQKGSSLLNFLLQALSLNCLFRRNLPAQFHALQFVKSGLLLIVLSHENRVALSPAQASILRDFQTELRVLSDDFAELYNYQDSF